MSALTTKAVFVDRDGTIIEECGPVKSFDEIKWIPGAVDALQRLSHMGYLIVIVTNQAAIAKGMVSYQQVDRLQTAMASYLLSSGIVTVDSIFCPHHPHGTVNQYRKACTCRKPAPGMLLTMAKRHDINLRRSWMIGDNKSDIEAGNTVGCSTILVETGHGRIYTDSCQPSFRCKTICDAPALVAYFKDCHPTT